MKSTFVALFVLALAGIGFAGYSFNDVVVEYWAGSGTNEAVIVVDFESDLSYAFGYRWDPSEVKTSYDALVAIDAEGGFDMDSEYDEGVEGYFINDFDYLASPKRGSSMSFFNSSDGQNWSSSWVGASDNDLVDGDWDGWTFGEWVWVGPGDFDWEFSGTVTTPVPEPASMLLLTLGGLLLRRKK